MLNGDPDYDDINSECSDIEFEGEAEPEFELCPMDMESDNENNIKDEPNNAGIITRKTVLKRQTLTKFNDIFSVRDLLGYGAFGVVLLVKNKVTDEKWALKILNKEKLSSKALSILKNESKIMCSLKHPSVVEFKQIYENSRFIVIEMEYIPGG